MPLISLYKIKNGLDNLNSWNMNIQKSNILHCNILKNLISLVCL
jgi:hypothetical protein